VGMSRGGCRQREAGVRELTGDPIPAIIVTGDLTQRPGQHDPASRIWVVHKPVNALKFRELVETILAPVDAVAEQT
jgi:hypothetical protein